MPDDVTAEVVSETRPEVPPPAPEMFVLRWWRPENGWLFHWHYTRDAAVVESTQYPGGHGTFDIIRIPPEGAASPAPCPKCAICDVTIASLSKRYTCCPTCVDDAIDDGEAPAPTRGEVAMETLEEEIAKALITLDYYGATTTARRLRAAIAAVKAAGGKA